MAGTPLEKQSPDKTTDKPSSKELIASLRDTTIPEIFRYIDEHWKSEVRVSIAKPGEILGIPPDWHGAEKFGRKNTGDAKVLFGSCLVTPIEGTRLPADVFIDGLHELGFVFENGDGKQLSDAAAGWIISSDAACETISPEEEKPVMRAIKNDEGKIIIEIRNGSMSSVMQELTRLGNSSILDEELRLQYRQAVSDCLGGFCAKGASAVRQRLQLFGTKRLTYLDDCLASVATIFGDQEVDAAMGRTHDWTLEEIRVSVASTQGIALAVKRSLDRNAHLLVRVGGLSYGLGNRAIGGSNYLINTQQEMLELGLFTVGDMGEHLSTGREGLIHPHVRLYRPKINRSNNETRIYLGGGLAMLELYEERINKRNTDPDSCVCILHASRINPPPGEDGNIHDWGVLFNGKTLPIYEPRN